MNKMSAENMSKETLLSLFNKETRSLESAIDRIHDLENELSKKDVKIEDYKLAAKRTVENSQMTTKFMQNTINGMNIQHSQEKQELINTYTKKIDKIKNGV